MASCAVPSLMAKDPRFQQLKEQYKDKHYSDDHLAQALQLCREYHDYDEDWYPVTSSQRGVFTRFMNYYLVNAKLTKTDSELGKDSVYNLYTTLYSIYTPEQLDARISMLSNDFRELVDDLEKRDRTHRSRQELIEAQAVDGKNGFVAIMERVFKIYEERYTDPEKMMENFDKRYPFVTKEQRDRAVERAKYRAQEYKTILANKERLSAIAATQIGEDEGFIVSINNFEIRFEEPTEEDMLDDRTEDVENTGEDKEEGSKGDRYGDFRTLKLMNTLSVRAKKLLTKIPKVNSKGQVILDDLGVPQYVRARQAAPVLKRVLVNSSPETMMSDLETAADFYPWIHGLIDILKKDTDLQSTVYDNFKSAETTYVYVNLENNGYTPHIANSRSAGWSLMREAGNNMRAGYVMDETYSVYTGYGSLKSFDAIAAIRARFESIKDLVLSGDGVRWIPMVEGDKPYNQYDIKEIIKDAKEKGKNLDYLLDAPELAMEAFLDANPDVVEQIAAAARGLGFAISAKDVRTISLQKMTPKGFGFIAGYRNTKDKYGRNKLYHLVSAIGSALKRAEDITKREGKKATGQYFFNTCDALKVVNSCLALAQYQEVEARVVNEGKSLSAYNNVNLLHQTFDLLTNKSHLSEEDYIDELEKEYLQYEGFALGGGEYRTVSGWLKILIDNGKHIRDYIRVLDVAAFNHVEYAHLSRGQKLTNSLIMFFNSHGVTSNDDAACYEVPIQADYSTAYNFVVAPKLSEDDIIDMLTDEVLMELERIDAIESRINDENRVKLSVYEQQGLKFQIFPEFNTNGFRERYTAIEDADEAKAFVRRQVDEQMQKVVEKDIKTISESGILTNPAMKSIDFGGGNYKSLYSEDGRVESLDKNAQERIRFFAMNVFYAREQMTKLITGGLEQFNGLIDYEKRNMMTHATRTSLYTEATYKGKRVGKETQNVAYIGDAESASAFYNDIKEMLQQLLDEKVISQAQFDTMLKAYSKIKTTDGQGLRTLDSYRTVMIMADQWDDRHELAYQAIVYSKPGMILFDKSDLDVFMQNIKPVFTGYEIVPAAKGEKQKPVKLTVLHKYSEMVLLPTILAEKCLQCKSVPFQALDAAQSELKKKGKEIDMFLFHSGVKVGAHSVLQPFAKWKDIKGDRKKWQTDKQARKEAGWTGQDLNDFILTDAKSISDYIVNSIIGKASTVHTLPFKYYGIAASTPPHVADDKIAWASQAEKVAWANILRGQKIIVNGVEMDAWDARETYFSIKTANIVESYKELRKLFTNPDELEKIFQEELASKSYSSRELTYALAHLKDGTFAIPLFSPNVEHQVQELLASIIKKRLTKPRTKGANILQSTGLGMDIEVSSFDNENALSEDEKLRVVFEGKGKNMRIKYVEVFLPIHDSRLNVFADKDGNISPTRLRKLVDNGTIPEEMLNFIAYRTPSDAEHSVIPCRIKGFIANTAGATIRMPKEIMVMTGHDYDGDKMRCHFANFRISLDKNKLLSRYQDIKKQFETKQAETDLVRYIFGQTDELNMDDTSFNRFLKKVQNGEFSNINPKDYTIAEYIPYDYNLTALENSPEARENGRIQLMFSELTSPAGSRRVLIPGGCDETKVIAKSMYLVRAAAGNKDVQDKIAEKLTWQGMSSDAARSAVSRTSSLYDALIRRSDGDLTDIVREVSSTEMPYTLSHSLDSFDYIMGGAEMIGIYALYNSALQMMQRLDMSYVPAKTQKGEDYAITIFGHTFGKLFEITNHRGRLASLGLARLLNAAVDNNKDPVLGYLNQTKEMAELTFLMFAVGMTEEEIHLVMNQPAVVKLINKLKDRESKGIYGDASDLIAELSANRKDLAEMGPWKAIKMVAEMTREDFTSTLGDSFESLMDSHHHQQASQQVAILQWLLHLNVAASNLAKFVKLTRPESESGSIGTTVADIIAKTIDLNEFRDEMDKPDSDLRISGMRDVIKHRDVHEGWDTSYIEEVLGTELPEVVALNSLMIDSSLEMFRPYFPTAKADWVDTAAEIAGMYDYKTTQDGIVGRIGNEMILWKLLSNKKFVSGNPQEEQRRILIETPKQVKDLKERIAAAQENSSKDSAAKQLIGNVFLQNLSSTSPENSNEAPRLQFRLNGPAVEGTADSIRAYWGIMLASEDESIRNLAMDLFKYNLYSNGFSYGMYEFSHFAPFSLILSVPGYTEALQDVLKSNWDNEMDRENFIHQYIMNHWGDKKFLPRINIAEINTTPTPNGVSGQLWISEGKNRPEVIEAIRSNHLYVIITSGENGKQQTLYRLAPGNSDADIVLVKAEKLGVRNRSQQITLQYNPTTSYMDVKPVVAGNDSVWGDVDKTNNVFTRGNINAAGMPSHDSNYMNSLVNAPSRPLGLKYFGVKPTGEQLVKVEKRAEPAVKNNDGKLDVDDASGLEKLLDASRSAWENGDYKFNYYFAPSEKLAGGLSDLLGHNVDEIHITGDTVRHIKRKHSSGESSRGQRDMTYEDIIVIPYLMNNYDAIEIDEKHSGKLGKAITIYKRINGISVVGTVERGENKDYVVTEWEFVKSNAPMLNDKFPPELNVQDGFDATKVQNDIDKIKSLAKQSFDGATPSSTPSVPVLGLFGLNTDVADLSLLQQASVRNSDDDTSGKLLSIVRRDESGEIVTENVPASPKNITEARKMKIFVELNKKLREILRQKGIDIGVLTNAEARMAIGGVADFDTANVTAEGFLEMIRIANGYEGEQALPEEFAHVALEMLGHDNPLVSRLLAAIDSSNEALDEAYGGMYAEYENQYGADNRDKLVLEAAGKLVAKHLFREQEIQTSVVKRLVYRVCDAIKSLLRKFSRDEVQNAIFDANQIASKVAREMLGGRLLDQMSLDNVNQSGQYLQVKQDLTGKEDILSKLLKTESKRLSVLKKRQGHTNGQPSASVVATQQQIAKLEAAIQNYKTEDAIVTYLNDSLGFLASMEKSLDDAVNSGRPVNSICRKLNMVRDTLYGFSISIDDIRESITSGEVQDNVALTNTIDQIAGVLAKFYQKYERLSRTYFEEMLSNVYGEHGKTVIIGKDKGRVITIKEMARKADKDISLVSRWFNSLADCDDYVLKAIDNVTRDAKIRARRRANAVRPRIEQAIAELEKATGSRDQSFMFEVERGNDGKMHKTGKYISVEASNHLSAAQKKFYDTMMSIKKDADACLPESLVSDDNRKIVMMRKYTMDRFKDAEGAKGKALEAWDGLKNRVMDMSDDLDFENHEVAVDFEGNRVDMLPVKFVMKGKNESYDDMSDDVATSMMAYAGMSYEYNELNGIIGILENARYMASERRVAQRTGSRIQRESIETDDVTFREPFTKRQALTNIQRALDDFYQMHIYGHIRANEGTIGRTRLSKRKVVDTVNAITSYSQMAINIPQRIANINTGLTQIIIESVGKGVFNAKDVAWASKIYVMQSGDRLAETGVTDYDNKLSLWNEHFDVHQNNGRNDVKYKKGRMSRIFNSSLLYAGLTMGEDYLATTTSLAIARNFRVKSPDGKSVTLWDAYEVKYLDTANKTGAYLALKDGYTKADGTPITAEDEAKFSKLVAGMNFELQGIYNLDDKSAIQQYAFGALLIMYRKWIAPSLKRRYAGTHYNLLKDDYEEGYHRTMFRMLNDIVKDAKNQVTEGRSAAALLNIVDDMKAIRTATLLNWEKMTPYERSNVKRSFTELAIVAGLYLACALLGKIPPSGDDDDDRTEFFKWWDQQTLSQLLRLRTEIGSQAPTPMLVDEAMHILRSPFAAIEPLTNTINAFQLIIPTNYTTEIRAGRYKGHVKAYKYFRELPIISMFKKVDNFIDPSPMIQYYQNDAL